MSQSLPFAKFKQITRNAIGGLVKLQITHHLLRLGERHEARLPQKVESVLRREGFVQVTCRAPTNAYLQTTRPYLSSLHVER